MRKYLQLKEFLIEYNERNSENKYRPVAVGRYGIRTRESIYSKDLAKEYSKNKLIYKNTLTVGMGSVQIDIGVLTEDSIYSVSPAYHTYKISNINAEYLRYCLECRNQDMFVRYVKRGSRQGKTIDLKRWLTYEIPVYDFEMQTEIVRKINHISNLIDTTNAHLSHLDSLVKSRFIEMFGDPKFNPNRYKIVPFSDLIEYMGDIGSNGANSVVVEHLDMRDEEDYALMVRFLNFTSNDFTENVKYISKEAYEFFKKSKIYGGELIFCKIGSAGLSYIMPSLGRPVSLGLNQIMVRINGFVNMAYLYNYIHTDYGEFLINGCVNGAVTKSITKGALKQIPIVLPPMELQEQFAAFVEQTDKSKFEIQKSLEKLEMLKKSLMQKYFG